MHYAKKICWYVLAFLLIGVNFALSACGNLTSPVDQAYYSGGSSFSVQGGYTRTIFSTSNF